MRFNCTSICSSEPQISCDTYSLDNCKQIASHSDFTTFSVCPMIQFGQDIEKPKVNHQLRCQCPSCMFVPSSLLGMMQYRLTKTILRHQQTKMEDSLPQIIRVLDTSSITSMTVSLPLLLSPSFLLSLPLSLFPRPSFSLKTYFKVHDKTNVFGISSMCSK